MRRRQFLKNSTAALLTAPIILNRSLPLFGGSPGANLINVYDAHASSLVMAPGKIPNQDGVIVDHVQSFVLNRARIHHMIDTAVKKVTGQGTVGKAWESVFPSGFPTRDTTVCIKLNLSYGERIEENDWTNTPCPFGPKEAVSEAIVMGLAQMLEGTFPIENITLFDSVYGFEKRLRNSLMQGYRPVVPDSHGVYKSSLPGAYQLHWLDPRIPSSVPEDGPRFLAAPAYPIGYRAPQRLYSVVDDHDFMINLVNAKTHREAGITGTMKNLYGCTDNPVGTHGTTEWLSPDSPYPGTRLCAGAFYKSITQNTPIILNILDSLAGVYYGGPLAGKVFHANTISISKNPVAIDTYLLNLINQHREKNGYVTLSTQDGWSKDGFPNAPSIRIASEVHGLGSMSLDHSRTFDLSQSSSGFEIPILENNQSRVGDVQVGRRRCEIGLFMDGSRRDHRIESRIEDLSGMTVKAFRSESTMKSSHSIKWNYNGVTQLAGPFIWEVKIDGTRHFRVFHLSS